MSVNPEKTKLVCFTTDRHTEYTASFTSQRGDNITSESELKLFGFILDSRAGAESHVESIERKFHQKICELRNLRKAGGKWKNMKLVYTSSIRAAIEYASVIYSNVDRRTDQKN